MTSSKPPDYPSSSSSIANLATIQQLRQWFDRVLILDFRRLEQTRISTINTIIVATLIFNLLLGGILFSSWNLLPKNAVTLSPKTTSLTTDLAKICPTEIAQSECNSLLISNPQVAESLSQHQTDANHESDYSWIEFYQIPTAIFLAIIALVWLFITLVGGAIDNYRLGWRSQIVRKIIDFIDPDRLMTYIGESDPHYLRQSLLHSGIVRNEGDDLIYIDVSDAIAIQSKNIRISWSNVRATKPTASILSIADRCFQIVHTGLGLQKFFKLNFASLIIKAIRAVIYLFKCAIGRQRFDYDDFSREAIGNDAGRKIVFEGIFCQILLAEKDELEPTIVLPKQSGTQPITVKIPQRLRKIVKLDDAEFDRVFTVYSSDRHAPKQILSPGVRRYALDYYRTSNYPIYLSIDDRMAYIAIITPSPFLEPKLGRNMLDFTSVQDYYRGVQFILNISAELGAIPKNL